MTRSFIRLRRALFGTCCAIVFGFGASQAAAGPTRALTGACEITGYEYMLPYGVCEECPDTNWCDGVSTECRCGPVGP